MYLGCNIVIIGILVYLHFTIQTLVFDLISHTCGALFHIGSESDLTNQGA